MIKIDFEFDSRDGVFRDALHLPEDHTFTDAEITAMKQQRYDNWISLIESTETEVVEPTPVEPAATVTISGATYNLLEGTPASGASLLEINGAWYVKA
jgi:hypothetical protein